MTLGINLTAAAGLPSLASSPTTPRRSDLSASGAAQITVTPATVTGSADTAALPWPRKPLDLDTPTGPPPTFAATVLELDANLQLTLARLNAAGYAKLPGAAPPKQTTTVAMHPALRPAQSPTAPLAQATPSQPTATSAKS
ncbi:MAG: hypothetical protein KGH84_01295 [Paracoccaceae bacterium]|nr:hypothetical protein [Paracoccaceae bacterium]